MEKAQTTRIVSQPLKGNTLSCTTNNLTWNSAEQDY